MIIGVGIDVVPISRFEAALARTPSLGPRLFVGSELAGPANSLAGRFAAKEAIAKALGAPGDLLWHDAVVTTLPSGQPVWELTGTVAARMAELGGDRAHLSISHDGGMAAAVVIVEAL